MARQFGATISAIPESKLAVIRHGHDDFIADSVKCQHLAPRTIGDLLTAEIAKK
jgi:hypothetical protein